MKALLSLFGTLLVCLTCVTAQADQPNKEALLVRSTTGRAMDSAGFATLPTPLKKGMTFDVVQESLGKVVLNVNGRKVQVTAQDVMISPKSEAAKIKGPNGFVPGKIVLLSAKYSLAGNQPRNVKNQLQKLVPQDTISAPVAILVSDTLSRAAQGQGDGIQTVSVAVTPEVTAVVVENIAVPKNVLTVEYTFNGKRMVKQALEGRTMVLP